MGSEWRVTRLADIIDVQHGWAFKGSQMSEELDEGAIVVAIGNFDYSGGFRFGSTRIKRYTGEYPEEYVLDTGDVLLAMTCQTSGGEILGIPGKIPDDGNTYLHNQRLGKVVLKAKDLASIDYLYWLFLTPAFNHHLYATATGTKILHTSPSKITSYETTIPSLGTQEKIAGFLWAIQNKFDLNRQTNQALESMAQALFKSWFVDFDPVIDNALAAGNEIPEPLAAKAAARRALEEQGSDKASQPHTLPDAIRQLFPSRFQFTEELGWIPEGWGVKPFRSVAQHIRESASAQNIDPNEVYVGLEHIGRKQLFLENSGVGSDVESNKSRFQKGDVLFGKLRPYFHKVALTDTNGICSTDILVFRAEDAAYQAFMALTAYREDFVAHANACSSGTRMPRANAKDLLGYQVVMPTRDLAQQLQTTVAPMWERAHANLLENSRLAKVRDALLPKLLSGELRIQATEKMLDEALA